MSSDRPWSAEEGPSQWVVMSLLASLFAPELFYKEPPSMLFYPVDVLNCLVYQIVPPTVRLSQTQGLHCD